MEERDPQTPQGESERTMPDVEAHKRVPPGKRVPAESEEEGTEEAEVEAHKLVPPGKRVPAASDEQGGEEADVEAHRFTTKNVPPKRVPQ